MKFQMYQDIDKQWRWRLVAANGKIVANSGEGYHNVTDCRAAIALVISVTANTEMEELSRF